MFAPAFVVALLAVAGCSRADPVKQPELAPTADLGRAHRSWRAGAADHGDGRLPSRHD